MIVRQAEQQDAARIIEFWNPMIRSTVVTFSTEERKVENVQADIASRGVAFQVAEQEGRVIGFATYFPFRSGPGYAFTKEHTIILTPEAQGHGVGRALMDRLCGVAREDGVHSLIAGVSGENTAGIAFHAGVGFDEIARLPEVGFKFGRWMDLVLMQKML